MERELHPKKFFTKEEDAQIIQAIQKAEKATSGELRIHLTKQIKKDPMREAIRIFKLLGMQKTKQRNGCLILIGLKNKKVVVIGDKGINDVVGDNFWDDVVGVMVENFKKGDYAPGLTQGILMIGEKLKQYFPYETDDVNELSDEISKEKL
ncbi:MAG: TPM domain-containing protein [Candidatus Omnitrophica bacterium]|nr:TPM domain-containing protein [Candidatus Omnitrophota bacterium]